MLGVLAGLMSLYFKRVYIFIERRFEKIGNTYLKLIWGGLLLGGLLVVFPSLYGEGYEVINACLNGDVKHLFANPLFEAFTGSIYPTIALLLLVAFLKVVAASLTFGAGGVGGIFAPTLFMGVNTGLAFGLFVNQFSTHSVNIHNFALIGMSGLIAGVLHAPLTGIFLIAELSGGYELFVPLMITATISYFTIRIFEKHSVYTHQLARRKELITHHKDNAIIAMMEVSKLIETDFKTVSPKGNLGDLVKVIEQAHRNLFPVVDENGELEGMVKLDDVRHLIFKPEKYEQIQVSDIMYMPEYFISPDDSMEDLVEKFTTSGRFNICVLDQGKYLGFISRAKAFTAYRTRMRRASED